MTAERVAWLLVVLALIAGLIFGPVVGLAGSVLVAGLILAVAAFGPSIGFWLVQMSDRRKDRR